MDKPKDAAPVVAIIGAGEMGAAVGQRLQKSGARVLTSLKGRGSQSVERVRQAGLEIVDDDDQLARGLRTLDRTARFLDGSRTKISRAAGHRVFIRFLRSAMRFRPKR